MTDHLAAVTDPGAVVQNKHRIGIELMERGHDGNLHQRF